MHTTVYIVQAAYNENGDIGWKLHQMFYHDVNANDPEDNWCRGVMQIVAFLAGVIWKQQVNTNNIIAK